MALKRQPVTPASSACIPLLPPMPTLARLLFLVDARGHLELSVLWLSDILPSLLPSTPWACSFSWYPTWTSLWTSFVCSHHRLSKTSRPLISSPLPLSLLTLSLMEFSLLFSPRHRWTNGHLSCVCLYSVSWCQNALPTRASIVSLFPVHNT